VSAESMDLGCAMQHTKTLSLMNTANFSINIVVCMILGVFAVSYDS